MLVSRLLWPALPGLSVLLGCCTSSEPMVTTPDTDSVIVAAQQRRGPGLNLTVRSSDDLQPMPARVMISAVGGTRPVQPHNDGGTGRDISADVLGLTDGVMLVRGQGYMPLGVGTYDLTFMQGPEYEWQKQRVVIGKDAVVPVDVTLEHSVRADGWLAADMHIHTKVSFDSKILVRHRVISEVTAGISVLVPTEHSLHYDFEPVIRQLGYDQRAVSVPGSEYGFQAGHIGVYPVSYDPRGELLGAPLWQRWPWGDISPEVYFPLIHAFPESPVIVVNHPRLLPDLGYFTNIGWPKYVGQSLSTAGLFDAMEVMNGYDNAPSETTPLLRDWFFFLGEGRRITGLANSDTHRVDWLRAGYPRTWLKLPTDVPVRVIPEDIRDAVKGMRAVGSNGPFLRMTVDGRDIGETVVVKGGKVKVRVEADGPTWMDLARVQIYRSGQLVREVPVTERRHPALTYEMDLDVKADGWVVAMVVGDQGLPVEVIGAVKGGQAKPLAFTNPVWLDADGDGQVKPAALKDPAEPQPFGPVPPPSDLRGHQAPLHVPLDCDPDRFTF